MAAWAAGAERFSRENDSTVFDAPSSGTQVRPEEDDETESNLERPEEEETLPAAPVPSKRSQLGTVLEDVAARTGGAGRTTTR